MKYYVGYIIFILIQSICFYSIPYYSKKIKNKLFIVLSCFELIVFTGLRADNVGADTLAYVSALDIYSYLNFNDLISTGNVYPYRFEWGYLWITKICAYLDIGHTFFLFIISVLIYVPTYRFFHQYSPYTFLSATIYFGLGLFGYSLGIFRQFLAMSIVLCGIEYIFQRNLIKWSLIILVSTMFHTTSLMCFCLYFIYKLNFKKMFFITLILQPILYISSRPILYFITSFFPAYFSYLGTWHDEIYGSMSMFIVYDLILIASYLYYIKVNNALSLEKSFINFIPLLCCVQAMAYAFPMLGRAIPYFSIFLTVTIPVIIKDMFPARQALVIATVSSFLFVLLFIYQNIDNTYILPFKFFWEI